MIKIRLLKRYHCNVMHFFLLESLYVSIYQSLIRLLAIAAYHENGTF